MEQELGVPWEDVFETIDPRPLAAGTIAQVHRATLADHTRAVVKVQRPDAKEQIEQDLALLEVFAEKVAERPGLKQVVDMEAVFEHLSESLHASSLPREAETSSGCFGDRDYSRLLCLWYTLITRPPGFWYAGPRGGPAASHPIGRTQGCGSAAARVFYKPSSSTLLPRRPAPGT